MNVAATDNIENFIKSGKTESKTQAAKAKLADDLDDFLKLLTTQLKHQDPTEPLETSQFTAQIAQLASVEQGINTNSNLEKLVALYSGNQVNNAVNYIGKRIEATGNTTNLRNSEAVFAYTLEEQADSVEVNISDEVGNVVFSGLGDTRAGRNEVYWNGRNNFNESQMADGIYTISVKAKNSAGDTIKSTTYTTGTVTAVDLANGEPTLLLGDHEVPLEDVLNIREDILGTPIA